jgi:hypothetical protein
MPLALGAPAQRPEPFERQGELLVNHGLGWRPGGIRDQPDLL